MAGSIRTQPTRSAMPQVISQIRRRAAVAAACLYLPVALSYSAPVSAEDLALMSHKTWTARDGAPQGVSSLALSPDGTLWIGSEGGLSIFDGRTFKPFRPLPGEHDVPAGPVRTMTAARDGAM